LALGLAGATASSVIGAMQSTGWAVDWLPQVAVPASTFGNKNMAAEYLILWVPLGLFLSLTGGSLLLRAAASVATGITFAYVFISGTRAVYLAAVASMPVLVGLVVVIHWLWPSRDDDADAGPDKRARAKGSPAGSTGAVPGGAAHPRALVLRAVTMVLLAVASWIVLAVVIAVCGHNVPPGQRKDPMTPANAAMSVASYSTSWRLIVWANTLAMARDHILRGVGLGNWRYVYPRYHRKVAVDTDFNSRVQADTPHNDYLQHLSETGLIGAAGHLLFVLVLAHTFLLGLSSTRPARHRLWTAVVLAATIAYAVDMVFSFPNSKAAPTFVLFLMLGAMEGIGTRQSAVTLVGPAAVYVTSAACTMLLMVVGSTQACWAIGDIRFKEGLNLYNAGRVLEAYELLKVAHRFRPFDPALGVFFGGICQETGHPEEALQVNEKARRQHPNFTNVLNQLGNLYWRTGRRDLAEQSYREVLSIHPEFEEALRNLASLCIERSRFTEARELLEKLVTREPNEPQHQLDLGEVYRALKKRERSREVLTEIIRKWPDNGRAYLALAHLSREERKLAQAEQLYRQALQIQPNLMPAHLYLGTLLADMGRKADAKQELLAALKIEPKSKLVAKELEKLETVKPGGPRIVDAPEAALREELSRDPKSPQLHLALANLYLGQRRFDLARGELEAVVKLDRKNVESWAKLGKVHAEQGRADEAMRVFRSALEVDPGNTIILNELGLIHQKKGDDKRALQLFEQAASAPAVPPEVWFNLGAQLSRAGRTREAVTALRNFLGTWKGDPQFRRQAEAEIIRLEAQSGSPEPGTSA
ncbi:MAG: tetratricopeptide repeat protein, partial [Candidatus Riflebacteria bacterium]|nr:tetratricopeptide repeat protein [Candidatus Riflebacteria bacterium]